MTSLTNAITFVHANLHTLYGRQAEKTHAVVEYLPGRSIKCQSRYVDGLGNSILDVDDLEMVV